MEGGNPAYIIRKDIMKAEDLDVLQTQLVHFYETVPLSYEEETACEIVLEAIAREID